MRGSWCLLNRDNIIQWVVILSQITNFRLISTAINATSNKAFASAIRGSWSSINSVGAKINSLLWFIFIKRDPSKYQKRWIPSILHQKWWHLASTFDSLFLYHCILFYFYLSKYDNGSSDRTQIVCSKSFPIILSTIYSYQYFSSKGEYSDHMHLRQNIPAISSSSIL